MFIWLGAWLYHWLWGQMLLEALRHSHDAAAAGLPWLSPNQLPWSVTLHPHARDRSQTGLDQKCLVCTSQHVRPHVCSVFRRMWRLGRLRGRWQRQMAEQSSHRMQLLRINYFLITIRMNAGFRIEEEGIETQVFIWFMRALNVVQVFQGRGRETEDCDLFLSELF